MLKGQKTNSNKTNNIEQQFAEMISFIRDKTGEQEVPITRDTLIEGELGVTGDDASQLIEMFSKKYQVDISQFQFEKYFNDEPSIFLPDRKVKPFTVGHLEKAIIAGKLDDEIINS